MKYNTFLNRVDKGNVESERKEASILNILSKRMRNLFLGDGKEMMDCGSC
jgi:hypothetical protein